MNAPASDRIVRTVMRRLPSGTAGSTAFSLGLIAALGFALVWGIDLVGSLLLGAAPPTASALALAAFELTVAVALGAAVGLLVYRIAARPIDGLIDHIHTQGHLAVEGVPYAGGAIANDIELPPALRELAAGVDDLLLHLNARQSDLKEAVRQARQAEDMLSVVVTESLEGKIVFRNGRVAVVNPAASAALGAASDLTDATMSSLFADIAVVDEAGAALDAPALLDRAIAGPLQVRLEHLGHPIRWYSVQASHHPYDLQNRVLLTLREVTEERRLRQVRNEMVSIISHDLRAPLAVIVGYLDLLSRPMDEETRERVLEAAKRGTGRMADLLEDLLSATRAEELLAPVAFDRVPLTDLVDEVVSSMAPTHTDRYFEAALDCHVTVLGEERRLRQAVVNLITNAFKYSPQGTPVKVGLECLDGRVLISVEDEGAGVPSERREQVFERFARLPEHAGTQPGIGLGLYIVRTIAENHGGSARVEDSPQGGARFVIDLPEAPAEGEPADETGATRAHTARTLP